MNIVLFEPEIPFNTGAIGRTCVALATKLFTLFALMDSGLTTGN